MGVSGFGVAGFRIQGFTVSGFGVSGFGFWLRGFWVWGQGFLGLGSLRLKVSGFGRCLACQLLITNLAGPVHNLFCNPPPPPPTRPRQTHSLPVSGSALFRLHVLYANLLDFRGGLDRPSEGSGLLLKSPPPLEGIFFRSFAVVPCFVICFFFFSFLFRYTKESSV